MISAAYDLSFRRFHSRVHSDGLHNQIVLVPRCVLFSGRRPFLNRFTSCVLFRNLYNEFGGIALGLSRVDFPGWIFQGSGVGDGGRKR